MSTVEEKQSIITGALAGVERVVRDTDKAFMRKPYATQDRIQEFRAIVDAQKTIIDNEIMPLSRSSSSKNVQIFQQVSRAVEDFRLAALGASELLDAAAELVRVTKDARRLKSSEVAAVYARGLRGSEQAVLSEAKALWLRVMDSASELAPAGSEARQLIDKLRKPDVRASKRGAGDEALQDALAIENAERAAKSLTKTPADAPVRPGGRFGSSDLADILTKTFTQTPFRDMAMQTRALYDQLWLLTYAQRRTFLTNVNRFVRGPVSSLTVADGVELSAWIVELFKLTYRVPDAVRPVQLEFSGRYFNPQNTSQSCQLVLVDLINEFFDPAATHSGGVSSGLVLMAPRYDRIDAFTEGLRREAFAEPVAMVSANPGEDSDDDDDDDDDEPLVFAPPSSSSSSSSAAAVPSDDRFQLPLSLFQERDSDPVQFLLDPSDLDHVRVSRRVLYLAIHSRRLRNAVDGWMVRSGRQLPPTDAKNFFLENQRSTEEADIDKVIAERERYAQVERDFMDAVNEQRLNGRLQMDQRHYRLLVDYLATLNYYYVGLYGAKADLLDYLKRQLTGPQPRAKTANHLVITGEPGTGKTEIGALFGRIMVLTGLVDAPTLRSYEVIGRTFQRNVSIEEQNAILATALPDKVPGGLKSHMSDASFFALKAAAKYTNAHASTDVYEPGSFESSFEGGRVAMFMLAAFRGLGGTTIIDEAYGLGEPRFHDVVDQLVGLITDLGTQWSTMLLGYDDAIRAFFASGNQGLERRYDVTVRFGNYRAIELVAIFVARVAASDNVTLFGGSLRDLDALAALDDDDYRVTQTLNGILDAVYEAILPWTSRGAGQGNNLFGRSNVGAVLKMISFLASEGAEEVDPNSSIFFIRPENIYGKLEQRYRAGKPFGTWTATRSFAAAATPQGVTKSD